MTFSFTGQTALAGLCLSVFLLISGVRADAAPQISALQNDMTARNVLVPHRAIYDIEMESAKSGAQVLGIQGKMMYSLKASCAGWITDHRFSMMYDYSESPAIQVDTRFSSFENYDGTNLGFTSTRSRNGDIYEEIRGQAEIDPAHPKRSVARFSIPDGTDYHLDQGTLFPVAHTFKLLESARSGQKVVFAHVFDGSDGDGPVDINAVIGKRIPAVADEKMKVSSNIDPSLLKVGSYPMRMAVFSTDGGELADYELSMDVLENGIVRGMIVDYHDFTISQKLVALEKVPAEKCGE